MHLKQLERESLLLKVDEILIEGHQQHPCGHRERCQIGIHPALRGALLDRAQLAPRASQIFTSKRQAGTLAVLLHQRLLFQSQCRGQIDRRAAEAGIGAKQGHA